MRRAPYVLAIAASVTASIVAACGGGAPAAAPIDDGDEAGADAASPPSGDAGAADAIGPGNDAAKTYADTLSDNRDRLLATYLAFLASNPSAKQSNGLSGSSVKTVCDLWSALDPSSRAVFLTLTARMQGSKLHADASSILVHVTKLYRCVGGQDATSTDPGSCGGGEYNRMIMSMDAKLHDAFVAANDHQGSPVDIADVPTHDNAFWRDSHDPGGPHAPFDLSDETDPGAPRGQVQYFHDPTSDLAKKPLGRMDLETLVDPYALEMDQDYDCPHDSNPSCEYTLYGPLCAPESSKVGTDIYTDGYGSFDPTWHPSGCP